MAFDLAGKASIALRAHLRNAHFQSVSSSPFTRFQRIAICFLAIMALVCSMWPPMRGGEAHLRHGLLGLVPTLPRLTTTNTFRSTFDAYKASLLRREKAIQPHLRGLRHRLQRTGV